MSIKKVNRIKRISWSTESHLYQNHTVKQWKTKPWSIPQKQRANRAHHSIVSHFRVDSVLSVPYAEPPPTCSREKSCCIQSHNRSSYLQYRQYACHQTHHQLWCFTGLYQLHGRTI